MVDLLTRFSRIIGAGEGQVGGRRQLLCSDMTGATTGAVSQTLPKTRMFDGMDIFIRVDTPTKIMLLSNGCRWVNVRNIRDYQEGKTT